VSIKTVVAPLTLGDQIWLSGAMVELATQHGELRVPSYPHYLESVRSFYVNHPEITVYEVPFLPGSSRGSPPLEAYSAGSDPIICGDHGPKVESIDVSTPEWHYRQLGVDFKHRWDSCPLQAAWRKVDGLILKTPEVFLHDDPSRGYVITRGPNLVSRDILRPSSTAKGSILKYAYALAQARFVYVIDSAFLHLCESIDTFGELFLHFYVKAPGSEEAAVPGGVRLIRHDFPTRKHWTILR
jgi:hypothetical protein